jgi:tetratricopeptide (TPR) repeat protein
MLDQHATLNNGRPAGDAVDSGELVERLRADQRRRWLNGERFGIDGYLAEYPALATEPEAVFELLYHEWLIREETGDHPVLDEYLVAYPALAERLRMQIEVHQALEFDEEWDFATQADSGSIVDLEPANGEAEPAVLPSVPGYEILDELGRGGMGVVYRARQLRPHRLVALKMILAGRFASRREMSRLQNEAEAIATLDHPNIVPVLDLGEHDGLPYFTMRLIAGGSLAAQPNLLRDHPRRAAELMIVIASAVHHAHQRGILHRDLKPANILIDDDGQPHVTDFGLAKRTQAEDDVTLQGAVLGSPAYMAPEQASGDVATITTATDVYGLGAILYTVLTGLPPQPAGSVHEVLERVRNDPPDAPSRRNPSVPRGLEIICLKCLEKDPARRYASAAAMADDLRRWLAGEPIQAKPAGLATRAWLWVRRRPVPAALAASLAAAVVAGTVGIATQWQRAESHLKTVLHERSLLQESEAKERAARLRAEARFGLALEAVENYYGGAADASKVFSPDPAGSRRKLLTQAADYFQKLQRSLEGDPSPEAQAQLALASLRFAKIATEISTEDVARPIYDRALAIYLHRATEAPNDPRRQSLLSDTLMSFGLAERGWGHVNDALGRFEESRVILEKLNREQPDDPELITKLTWTLGNIATVQLMLGQREAALHGQERVLAIREEYLRKHPENFTFRLDRAWVLRDIGSAHGSFGRFDEALRYFRLAVDELEAAHAERPRDLDTVRRLLDCVGSLAQQYCVKNRPDLMVKAGEREIEMAEKLARALPKDFRVAERLGQAYRQQYRRLEDVHDRRASRPALERSIRIYEKLARQFPSAEGLQRDLAAQLFQHSIMVREDGDLPLALRSAESSRDLWASLSHREPDPERIRTRILDCELALASIYWDSGRKIQALAALERGASGVDQMSNPPWYVLYNLACTYSWISGDGANPPHLTVTLAQDRALGALRRAIAAGYRDRDHLDRDHDLDPIRHRAEFQQIVQQFDHPTDVFMD